MKRIVTSLFILLLLQACTDDTIEKKGFQVSEITETEEGKKIVGLPIDSLKLHTRPRNVLLTKHTAHRLIPIYKVNYNKKTNRPFIGSNRFHTRWEEEEADGNNWNSNFMPGFSAMFGYNLVNIAHYNYQKNTQNEFFDKPVLIRTLYFPAFSQDTLNYQPVKRDYYMVSVYDEDSNQDGFINARDLRRLYLFDINGILQKELIPKNYSVMSSEYDSDNDLMYVFAKMDQNDNGQMDEAESTHIFSINLKQPETVAIVYKEE